MPEASGNIDWDAALHSTGGDPALLRNLIDLFLADAPRALSELSTVFHSGDPRRVEYHAHSLKGSLQTLGALNAAELARELEALARSHSLEEAPPVFERLLAVLDRVSVNLAAFDPACPPVH